MDQTYLLGVDIGTYSSKGVLVREGGSIVAAHNLAHTIQMPHPGHFEQDADQVWWGDFVLIVRALLIKTGIDSRSIRAVGVSGIGPCVLPVDEQGIPLRPGILYGIDTRAGAEIAQLEQMLGREEIFRRCAMNLDSQAAGPKVLWLRNHEPEVYRRVRWFLTSQAYLVYRLTGLASIDVYTAGYYAPLYDVPGRSWNPEAARHVTPLERLPRVYWTSEVVGEVTEAAARETGLAQGTPVIAGTADAAAEAVSAGVADGGDMLLMFGSSIFYILKTDHLVWTERFWSSNFLRSGDFAFAGGMSTSGSLTTWFRDRFAAAEVAVEQAGGENAYAALAGAAAASPVGSNGLLALPYFEGERTPLNDPKARGMWFGLGLKHTRADLYRAILEGVAFGIRHNLEAMAEEGMYPRRILVSGGGIHNRLWLQIVADVCGIELNVPDQAGGACYGDAFLASVGCNLNRDLSDIGRWTRTRETIHPDLAAHQQYGPYYRIFRDLYSNTKDLMHRLNDLAGGENG